MPSPERSKKNRPSDIVKSEKSGEEDYIENSGQKERSGGGKRRGILRPVVSI